MSRNRVSPPYKFHEREKTRFLLYPQTKSDKKRRFQHHNKQKDFKNVVSVSKTNQV